MKPSVFYRLLLAGCVLTGICTADAPPRVLILFSNDRLLPANQEVEKGLRRAFEDGGKTSSVDLFAEFLDAVRFPGPEQSATMEEFLRGRHRDTPPDAWIALGPQALDFLMQRWDSLFPGTPAGAYVGKWLQSFREFPTRQKPGSFNLDRVMEAVTCGSKQ